MSDDARAVAERLYAALERLDGAAMAACYAGDARFSDPGFPDLHGARIGAMWRMLCGAARDWSMDWRVVEATADRAVVEWIARYRFGGARRPVVNRIRSELEVRDGHIVRQRDAFDFARWARQALGFVGWAMGWSRAFQAQVQKTMAQRLEGFIAREAR